LIDFPGSNRQHGDNSIVSRETQFSPTMKRSLLVVAVTFFLFNLASARAGQAVLQVKRDNATVLTLRISDNSLRFFGELPSQLTAILRENGVDCCASNTRINATSWKCCHGKFVIVSSDAPVQEVLAAAFNQPKLVCR
jgi:hypothetical protein